MGEREMELQGFDYALQSLMWMLIIGIILCILAANAYARLWPTEGHVHHDSLIMSCGMGAN